jgi:hypothetical protein
MTVQIQLNTELAQQLDAIATSRGSTPEQIILELIQQETSANAPKPRPSWIGIAASGISDLGSRARDYIREELSKDDSR